MAKGKVKVTPDGVRALKTMAQDLLENISNITSSTNDLQETFEENRAALAPHADSLGRVIEDVKQTSSAAAGPTEGLTDQVIKLAGKYEEFINDDPFAGISGN